MEDIDGTDIKINDIVIVVNKTWLMADTSAACGRCIENNENQCCIGNSGVVSWFGKQKGIDTVTIELKRRSCSFMCKSVRLASRV